MAAVLIKAATKPLVPPWAVKDEGGRQKADAMKMPEDTFTLIDLVCSSKKTVPMGCVVLRKKGRRKEPC